MNRVLCFFASLAALAIVTVLLVTAYESGLRAGFELGRADAALSEPSPFYSSTRLTR